MKRNYQQELDEIISGQGDKRPKLLLHSCCGPCSAPVLEYLTQYYEVTLFWYNPNIWPEKEYDRRLAAQQKLIRAMGLEEQVRIAVIPGGSDAWHQAIEGLENEPEGGERCARCFRLRLSEAAEEAAKRGCDWFTTTLTISPLKNAELLNEIGEQEGKARGVRFLPCDFKKKDGFKRSTELSAVYGLYRQSYCGCIYSKRERGV